MQCRSTVGQLYKPGIVLDPHDYIIVTNRPQKPRKPKQPEIKIPNGWRKMEIGETIQKGDQFFMDCGGITYSFYRSVGEILTKNFELLGGGKVILAITSRPKETSKTIETIVPLTEKVTLSEKYNWTISQNGKGQLILTPAKK